MIDDLNMSEVMQMVGNMTVPMITALEYGDAQTSSFPNNVQNFDGSVNQQDGASFTDTLFSGLDQSGHIKNFQGPGTSNLEVYQGGF